MGHLDRPAAAATAADRERAALGARLAVNAILPSILRHRALIWELTRRELLQRHGDQALGSFWIIAHPLVLMAVYATVFTVLFPARVGDDVGGAGLVGYVLSGLIPWITVAETMARSSRAVVADAVLVKQIVFPVEALPPKAVFATFLSQLVATAFLLLWMLLDAGRLPLTVLLLPVLFAIQILAMIGIAYLLSSITVFIRDTAEVVQVVSVIGLFAAPILYRQEHLEALWPPLGLLIAFNPFSHMVWAYRDVLYHGAVVHPWSWGWLILFAAAAAWLGTRMFGRLRDHFPEAL